MLQTLNKEIAPHVAAIMVYANEKDGIRAVLNHKEQRSNLYAILGHLLGLPTEERTESGINAFFTQHADDAVQALTRIEESWKENVVRLSLVTLLQLLKTPADKSPEKKGEQVGGSQKEIRTWNNLAKPWLPRVSEGVVSVQYTREKCAELIQANADHDYVSTILTSLVKSTSKTVLQKLMKGTFPQLTQTVLGKMSSEDMKVSLAHTYDFEYQPPVKRPRLAESEEEEEEENDDDVIPLSEDEEEMDDMRPPVVEIALRLTPKDKHTAKTAQADFEANFVTEHNVNEPWPATYNECIQAVKTFMRLKNSQLKDAAQDCTVIATLMSFPHSTYGTKHISITRGGWMTNFNSDIHTAWSNTTREVLQGVYTAMKK